MRQVRDNLPEGVPVPGEDPLRLQGPLPLCGSLLRQGPAPTKGEANWWSGQVRGSSTGPGESLGSDHGYTTYSWFYAVEMINLLCASVSLSLNSGY